MAFVGERRQNSIIEKKSIFFKTIIDFWKKTKLTSLVYWSFLHETSFFWIFVPTHCLNVSDSSFCVSSGRWCSFHWVLWHKSKKSAILHSVEVYLNISEVWCGIYWLRCGPMWSNAVISTTIRSTTVIRIKWSLLRNSVNRCHWWLGQSSG